MTTLLKAQKAAWHAPIEPRAHRTKLWLPHAPDPKRWVLRAKSRADEPLRVTSQMEALLQQCRNLTALPEDWDEAGASVIDSPTVETATRFLRAASEMASAIGRSLPLPVVSPCHDGSIDLFWKSNAYQLLVNIQPPHANESDFYGETAAGFKFKGTFRSGTSDASVIPTLLEIVTAP